MGRGRGTLGFLARRLEESPNGGSSRKAQAPTAQLAIDYALGSRTWRNRKDGVGSACFWFFGIGMTLRWELTRIHHLCTALNADIFNTSPLSIGTRMYMTWFLRKKL